MTSLKSKKFISMLLVLAMTLTLLPATVVFGASYESIEDFVENLYVAGLGRQPDHRGFIYWVNELKKDRSAAEVIAHVLLRSEEFKEKYADISNEEFVKKAYNIVFGREADEGGLKFWVGQMNKGGSQLYVIAEMLIAPPYEFKKFCDKVGIRAGKLEVPKDEYPGEEPIEEELQVVEVCDIDPINIVIGEKVVLPETVTAVLNNGEEVELAVEWEEFESDKAGVYEVKGIIVVDEEAEYVVPEELLEVSVVIVVEKFAIKSVKAVNPTTIKVVFNKAVEELTRTDVVVTNVKTSDRQYVKSVTLAEDKKSAEVVFYDNLVDKNTYKVVIGEAEKEFDFVIGDVAKIEAETLQVVEAGKDTPIKYKVLDANGLDITANVANDITFETTLTITNGKVNLTAGTQGFVYVVYKAGTDEEVKSARITVKAEAPKIVKLLAYTVGTPNFTDEDFKAVTTVQKGDNNKKISVYVEDQFGNKYVNTSDGTFPAATFESLNKQVALVDRNNGTITPIKEGTADVRITIGEFTTVRPIEVVADSKIAALSLEKTTIEMSDKISQTVDVVVKDQYGNNFKPANETKMTATIKSGSNIIELDKQEFTFGGESDTATFTITPVEGKEGTATIEFAIGDVKTTLTVNVVKAGVVDNYVVEGFKTKLDKNSAAKDEEKKMVLKVFAIDANGVKIGPTLTGNVHYAITDKDKNPVIIITASEGELTVDASSDQNLKAGETYKLTVKVGPNADTALKVFEGTFEVVDTSPQPVVTVKNSKIEATNKVADIIASLGEKLEVKLGNDTLTYKAVPVAATDYKITKVTFVSDNSALIASATDAEAAKTKTDGTKTGAEKLVTGEATLVISKIEIEVGTGEAAKSYTIDLNEIFTVKVTQKAPAAPTGLEGVAPDSAEGQGKITGTTTKMEYKRKDAEGGFTSATGNETEVAPGTYLVRFAEVVDDINGIYIPASPTVEVVVPTYEGVPEE